MKNKKIKKKVIMAAVCLSLITILFSLFSFAYYTNTNKFFEDSRTDDGNSGQALERESNEFIVDGCGSGTMLDTLTGLCWDKNMNHAGVTKQWATDNAYLQPIWNDGTKSYSYPAGRTSADYPALEYCEDLIIDSKTDFRLPTNNELFTLINATGPAGSTCTTLSNFNFTNCQDNYYWTQKERVSFTSYVWIVNFNGGASGADFKTISHHVVCVRR